MANEENTPRPAIRDLTCLCGCGRETIRRVAMFLSGHDAKLKSILIKEALGEDVEIPEIAKPWLDGEDGLRASLLAPHRDSIAKRLAERDAQDDDEAEADEAEAEEAA